MQIMASDEAPDLQTLFGRVSCLPRTPDYDEAANELAGSINCDHTDKRYGGRTPTGERRATRPIWTVREPVSIAVAEFAMQMHRFEYLAH